MEISWIFGKNYKNSLNFGLKALPGKASSMWLSKISDQAIWAAALVKQEVR